MTSIILFQCYIEANNDRLCKRISKKMHSSSTINLSHSGTLMPCDIRCLTLFLSKTSTKQWKVLDLSNCLIGDDGLRMLHEAFITSDIIIDQIFLEGNSLTSQSSVVITEIASSCKTKKLHIPYNTFTDGLDLSNNSTLEKLYIYNNKVSSTGAGRIFTTLTSNKKSMLRELKIYGNSIDDEAVNDITQFLTGNNILEQFSLLFNCFSVQGKVKILRSLHNNQTLKELLIGTCNENPEIMAEINGLQSKRPKLGIY
ncbi:leucine-rich repeat-containing protein 74B-like [Dysidea avara]|uniref:leucine-rich repeat-containing protein 74B-like n=1 Tax=Dysidea avara TaxID=196820 RepID=UPI003319A5E3